MIIIDECHRSIYVGGELTDYFNTAKMVGLTAAPAPETLFFNNRIVNYTLEKIYRRWCNVIIVYTESKQATEDEWAPWREKAKR